MRFLVCIKCLSVISPAKNTPTKCWYTEGYSRTESQTDTKKTDISKKTHTENDTEKIFNTDYTIYIQKWSRKKLTETIIEMVYQFNKKAQLSLTNPRDAKACPKLLQFDVLTTSSLTILAYLHSFSCCCVRNLRNPAKFTENSNLWSSRLSKVIDLGVNRKPMYEFLLVTNSNFGRICYRFRDIDA